MYFCQLFPIKILWYVCPINLALAEPSSRYPEKGEGRGSQAGCPCNACAALLLRQEASQYVSQPREDGAQKCMAGTAVYTARRVSILWNVTGTAEGGGLFWIVSSSCPRRYLAGATVEFQGQFLVAVDQRGLAPDIRIRPELAAVGVSQTVRGWRGDAGYGDA